jgi:hypothetical protein
VTLHALQALQEVLAQQTPSVHMPLRQTALLVHVPPSGFRLVQMPLWQMVPATQSVSIAQTVKQAVGPQTKLFGQGIAACPHVPAPLQVLTMLFEPVQVVAAQLVPVVTFRQAPLPSHVPSYPHGGLAVQSWCGSAFPVGTGWHEPAVPGRLHAWQVPQVPAEQQTPSTQ